MKTAVAASVAASPVHVMHSKRAILGDCFALGASRYFAFGLSFVAGIVQRRLLGPYVIGIWQMLAILRQYLSYGDLGVARGAEQRLPALVASRSPEVASVRDTTFVVTLISVALVNVGVLIGTFAWPWPLDAVALWGIRGMTVLAIVESMANTMEVSVLRAPARFRLLSQQVFLSETLFAVLSIPAAMLGGVLGLLGAALASLVLKLLFMRATTRERMRLQVDWGQAIALWKVGFPLTLYAIVYKTFDALDRILLVQGGNVEALGHYSLSIMTTVFLAQFPAVIGVVFFPRTMGWFELRERAELARYFEQAQLGILIVVGVASAVCYEVMPHVVRFLLPSFVAGIPAMKVGIISAILVGLTQLPLQFLIGSNRQWSLVGLIGAATAVYYGAGMIARNALQTPAEWLQFAAWSRLAAYLVLALAMTVWALRLLARVRVAWMAEMLAIGVYLGALPVLVEMFLPSGAALRFMVVGVGIVPMLVLLDRRTAVASHLVLMWRDGSRPDKSATL